MNVVKIGVLGAGHLGKIHLRCIRQVMEKSERLELVGFYDPNSENAARVAAEFQIQAFESVDALLDAVDAVDIVTPTTTHFELALHAARRKKHLFIEKPLTHTVAQAEALIEAVEKAGVKAQVGYVERFNPAVLSLPENFTVAPMFIEAHRLATFNPRGTDVSVVLDLMIHDIDIVLSFVRSEVRHIHASGVSVVSASPDIANARIEFENNCVANLTASRMSLKQMRKVRMFQPDAYISLDFLEKNAQIIRLSSPEDQQLGENSEDTSSTASIGGETTLSQKLDIETSKGIRQIEILMPQPLSTNAIEMELDSFGKAILENSSPRVTIYDGYRALKIAHQIVEAINDSTVS
jgi:predicted dehydrogenase